MWYNNWNIKVQSVVISIGYPMSDSHWRKELTNLLSGKDSAEGIKSNFLSFEYMLQERLPIIRRNKMKYVDFKGREWSVEKGDWVSYQMLDKHNQQSLLNKSILKKFFYLIFLALLTVYFWLA
jgi:hypothetical protein